MNRLAASFRRMLFRDEACVRRIASQNAREPDNLAARILIRALDSYPKHPGRKGGGSLPRGASPADMRRRAKENKHVRNGLDGDDSFYIVTGFRKGKKESHSEKHAKEMGFKNTKEYQQAGIAFMEGPLSEFGEEIIMKDGRRCRVDHDLGYVGIVNGDGSLKTFYDPKMQYGCSTVETIEGWIKADAKDRNQ